MKLSEKCKLHFQQLTSKEDEDAGLIHSIDPDKLVEKDETEPEPEESVAAQAGRFLNSVQPYVTIAILALMVYNSIKKPSR